MITSRQVRAARALLGWSQEMTPQDNWQEIRVPHTWQTDAGYEEYVGAAWYRCQFEAPKHWKDLAIRVEFEAVYHSATVWLNGTLAGEHTGDSGTPHSGGR